MSSTSFTVTATTKFLSHRKTEVLLSAFPGIVARGIACRMEADCSCLPSRNLEVISLATAGRNVQYY